MYYSLTRATTWNIVGYLYLIIASFISTPILVHSLGLAQFAQYSLVIATLALVSALNLGLPQAVVRSLAQHRGQSGVRAALWATSSLLFVLTGIVTGVIAVAIGHSLGISATALPIIFLTALMTNVVGHYSTLPQAEGHFGYFNAKTFIVGTGNTLIAAYLAWIGQNLTIILSAQLACYLLTVFV
jgi:O-antigen/teichoic acid export membrane protein